MDANKTIGDAVLQAQPLDPVLALVFRLEQRVVREIGAQPQPQRKQGLRAWYDAAYALVQSLGIDSATKKRLDEQLRGICRHIEQEGRLPDNYCETLRSSYQGDAA
ncbi:MAG: hypothetical protein AABY13_02440 [Nanoarchaeota archaeon]